MPRAAARRLNPKSKFEKWGNGCWIVPDDDDNNPGKIAGRPVAYVYSDTGYVQFGFFNGSALKDPKRLLEGKGAYVRHIKLRAPSGIDKPAFTALLKQAAD